MLFRSAAQDQPEAAVGHRVFFEDPLHAARDGAELVAVRLPEDQFARLKPSKSGGLTVPASVAAEARRASPAEIERFSSMRGAYEDAKAVRRSLTLIREDCVMPGEMSPVARILWRHVPEAAARAGVHIPKDEGGPVLSHFARDVERAAPVASYLSCREDAAFLGRVCTPGDPIRRSIEAAAQVDAARMSAMSASLSR